MAKDELEWWEQQQNDRLKAIVREALDCGIDAATEIQKALRGISWNDVEACTSRLVNSRPAFSSNPPMGR